MLDFSDIDTPGFTLPHRYVKPAGMLQTEC